MLTLVGVIATLWLAATGQLSLYIHPRYILFSVILALIAAALAVTGFLLVPAEPHNHNHARDPGHPHPDGPTGELPDAPEANRVRRAGRGTGRLRAAGSLTVVAAAVIGLLLLPPSRLSAVTASQRDLNVSGTLTQYQTQKLAGKDPSGFDVRDWASVLRYPPAPNYLTGKTATVTGFITEDPNNPSTTFYVTRFIVTCCTVDAQPVGVPVYDPGWQARYKSDQWVTVTGGFRKPPGTPTGTPDALIPSRLTATTQPDKPYLY